jgi:hypothetical protein
MSLSFFGPWERHQGLFGAFGRVNKISFTIHIFPRANSQRWGFSTYEDYKSFDLGFLFCVCWDDLSGRREDLF